MGAALCQLLGNHDGPRRARETGGPCGSANRHCLPPNFRNVKDQSITVCGRRSSSTHIQNHTKIYILPRVLQHSETETPSILSTPCPVPAPPCIPCVRVTPAHPETAKRAPIERCPSPARRRRSDSTGVRPSKTRETPTVASLKKRETLGFFRKPRPKMA